MGSGLILWGREPNYSAKLTLVGHDEDERGRALDGLDNVGDGNDIVAERDVGEVLDVDVLLVDNVGELAAVDLRRW